MTRPAKAMSAFNFGRAQSAGRFGIASACVLALLALAGISASSALAVDKSVIGVFGSTGSLGGELNTPRGVAVNQASGDIYIADSANHRVTVLNAEGEFVRAFGQDVFGRNEQQRVTITATEGTFRLCKDIDLTECTANINFNATGAQVASALVVPAMFGAGNVGGSGTATQPKLLTFQGDLAGTDIDQLILDTAGLIDGEADGEATIETVQDGAGGNFTGYEICEDAALCKAGATGASTGGAMQNPQGVALDAAGNVYVSEQNKLRVQKFSPTGVFERAWGRDVVASGPGNKVIAEEQTITVKGDSGTFTLSFGGQTTAPLAHDVPASGGAGPTASIQNALNALSTIGGVGGSVTVTGPVDDTFTVIFGGDLEGDNVGQISIDDSGLGIPVGTELSCAVSGNSVDASKTQFQWLSGGAPATGPGSTTDTYTTVAADEGNPVQCQAFAFNTANVGSTQFSTPRIVVSDVPDPLPPLARSAIITSPPGANPGVGTTVSCHSNSTEGWTGVTEPFEFQWYKDGAPIADAEAESHELEADDVPGSLQCVVTGSNASGSVSKASGNRRTSPAPSGTSPGGNTGSPDVAVSHDFLSSTATTVQGNPTPFEVCVAADLDVCKSGVAGSGGGEFNSGGFDGQLAVVPTGGTAPNAGNVLVADNRNLRIQEFEPDGEFVRAFGFGVVTGAVAFEECTVATDCSAGVSGNNDGQFTNSVSRVVEDADGNIYTVQWVGGAGLARTQKFTTPGNVVTPQGDFCTPTSLCNVVAPPNFTTRPLDVAIDPATQNVLVTKSFVAGATPTCPNTGAPSLDERRVVEVSPAGTLQATHMTCAAISTTPNPPNVFGLAVRGSTGEVYVSSTEGGSRLFLVGESSPPTVSLTSITDIGPNTATVNGFVNPNVTVDYGLPTGFHVRFKRSSDPDSAFSQVPAVDIDLGKGTTNQLVSQKLPFLEPGTSYDVKMVAAKAFGGGLAESDVFSFSTPTAKAEVGIPSATTAIDPDSGEAKASLYGKVNPNGKETTYRFEYGTTASYGTKIPVPDESVGAGVVDVPVAQFIDDLEPATTYHFRLVAKNINGSVSSLDRTFTTPPPGAGLPDNRAYELVSPADKGTAGSVSSLNVILFQLWNQAAEDGDSFLYPIQNGIADSSAGGWARWRAERTDDGWLQQQISAPSLVEPPAVDGDSIAPPSRVIFASPDLSCAVLQSYNPLTADTPQASIEAGMENLYVWRAEDGSYELITNLVPQNPSPMRPYDTVEAADDCSRVYFRVPYVFFPGGSGLYEWDEGTLRDAGLRPDGSVGPSGMHFPFTGPTAAIMGGELDRRGTGRWNAVSPDGSRLFFTAISNESGEVGRPAVFMRENGGESVVNISRSQTAVPTNGARFEAASADGSKVVFRANYGIAATSSPGPTGALCGPRNPGETIFTAEPPIEEKNCDLYVYDVETGELTDISADTNPSDPAGAQIQGAVAVDRDGSHVYFAALGQLVPGEGRTYAQNTAGGGSANVYLYDAEAEGLSYVTTLSHGTGVTGDLLGGGESNGGNGALMRRSNRWSAQTSADGNRLLFTSSSNLTGQDNEGGKAAYLYSADTDQLACLSCRPDGQPTLDTQSGVFPTADGGRLDSVMMLARSRAPFLTHRPRSMSEDGSRVFFTSANVLAPGATAGERNIYQWADGQVGFLATVHRSGGNGLGEYLDASADGKTAFFATDDQLVPEDKDFVADVYAVRVDGGFPFTEPPPGCQVDEAVPLIPNQIYCQGDASAQPGAVGLASPGFFGPGNPAPAGQPAPRCNRQQVRRGNRCVAKRALARRACAKRKGKAKRRCIANQMRRLNRLQQRQWRQQQRRANANRGGAR